MIVYYLRLFTGTVLLFVLSLFLIITGIKDIKYRKICNSDIFYICITGIILRIYSLKPGVVSIIAGVISISIFLIASVLIVPGSFGGGDIKLLMASSFFLGMNIWNALAIAVFASFPFVLSIVISDKKVRHFPFGPYICLGIFIQTLFFLYGLT